MSHFNPEIHHRKSTRLKGYDYSQPGHYFITINLENIRCMLAGWENGKLKLFPPGETVKRLWLEIPQHYPNVELDEFIVMPEHVHGILNVGGMGTICKGVQFRDVPKCKDVLCEATFLLNVPTPNTSTKSPSSDKPPNPHFSQLSPSGNSLSVIIRNFKATVKRWCNENGYTRFKWQSRFYDRIIRSEDELCRIRWYIKNNPATLQNEFPALKGTA